MKHVFSWFHVRETVAVQMPRKYPIWAELWKITNNKVSAEKLSIWAKIDTDFKA